MTPFGHLADGNPYEAYLPPDVLQAKGIQPCIRAAGRATSRSDTTSGATGAAAASRSCSAAYNFDRRLKTLSGLTPYEYIAKIWTSEPDRFIVNPIHQMPGLNT